MITLVQPVPAAKLATEIARLTKLNDEANDRIRELRAQFANEHAVMNARRGITYREDRIAELRNLNK